MSGRAAFLFALGLAAASLLAGGCGGSSADEGTTSAQEHSLRGASASPTRRFPLLVAAGDIACPAGQRPASDACRQAATAALVARLRPTVVAALGDTQYETGAFADFERSYRRTWGRFRDRTRPAPGNHEYASGAGGYFRYFGRRAGPPGRGWYSFDVGGWHVVSLNSNCQIVGCEAGSPQERWLRRDLAAHPRRCTLAYWHHPRFSSGVHGDDDAVAPLWRALQEAGADLVLAGHDHDYERFAPRRASGAIDPRRGIPSIVAGTGGRSLRPFVRRSPGSVRRTATTFGVLALELRAGGYAFRFVGLPGSRFVDGGVGRCR